MSKLEGRWYVLSPDQRRWLHELADGDASSLSDDEAANLQRMGLAEMVDGETVISELGKEIVRDDRKKAGDRGAE